MAEERGISLNQVNGSGPGGRIVKKDLDSYVPVTAPAEPALAPAVSCTSGLEKTAGASLAACRPGSCRPGNPVITSAVSGGKTYGTVEAAGPSFLRYT